MTLKWVFLTVLSMALPVIGANAQVCRTPANPKFTVLQNPVIPRSPFTVAVVVHILYENEQQNISEQRIAEQLNALNRDFNRRNTEWEALPGDFKDITANAQIEFCLAGAAPDGSPTNGITRTPALFSNIGLTEDVFYSDRGGADAWQPDKYLNIWVAGMPEEVLGYSSGPNDAGGPRDGVVINSLYFGTTQAKAPFQLGRTLVHEIGHYFGLSHPWGNITDDCDEDDNVSDTPFQRGPHTGCPPKQLMGCDIEKVYWNFMDYTPDACMAMFTKGQVQVMHSIIQQYRETLASANIPCYELESALTKKVSCFPNPSGGDIHFDVQGVDYSTFHIFNAVGVWIESGVFQQQINLSHLTDGLYFIRLNGNGNTYLSKVVLEQ